MQQGVSSRPKLSRTQPTGAALPGTTAEVQWRLDEDWEPNLIADWAAHKQGNIQDQAPRTSSPSPMTYDLFFQKTDRMGDGMATRHLGNEPRKATPFPLSRGQIWEQTLSQPWGSHARLIPLIRISCLHPPPVPN